MFIEFKDIDGNTHLLPKTTIHWITDNTSDYKDNKKVKSVVTIIINKTKIQLPSPETIKSFSGKLIKEDKEKAL
jgi:hypothetical protein